MNTLTETILSTTKTGTIRWESDPILSGYAVPSGIYIPIPGAASTHAPDMSVGEYASPALTKALRLYAVCSSADESQVANPLASQDIAIGIDNEGKTFAEYRYSIDEGDPTENADVAIFDPAGKIMKAGICAKEDGSVTALNSLFDSKKKLNPGVAIILALLPNLFGDEEFSRIYGQLEPALIDPSKADSGFYKGIAVLTSNFIARAESSRNSFGLNKGTEASVKVLKVKQISDPVEFTDSEYALSTFKFFGSCGKQAKTLPAKLFNGKFRITPSADSDAMIMPDSYLVPQVIIDICQDIKDSTKNLVPVRNIMLLGPSGTGKSEGAKAIAAGLGIPYEAYTCHSKTDLFEIFGGYVPNTDVENTDADIPSPEDMEFDPEGSYERLTGSPLKQGSKTDLYELFSLAIGKVKRGISSKSRYRFVESATTRAIKSDRYKVLEIQELDRIKDAGTITMLNEILCYGKAQLPNGQVIKRDQSTIIVFTANVNYAASRQMDQSVISRCEEVEWIELPTKDELVMRAMARTGCSDKGLVTKMAGKVMDISKFCEENGITDGSCGFRELIAWISTVMLGRSYEKQAVRCVINKCTLSSEDKHAIAMACFNMEYDEMLSL